MGQEKKLQDIVMTIAGLQKTTLIDYPGKIACSVFTYGCNFRCPFCHNPELVTKKLQKKNILSEKDFFEFLKKRKKLLDGVVITGGEPCLQKDLVSFCKKIKKQNFLIKLDTNGSFPEVLEALLEEKLLDYVAMDIKSSFDSYSEVSGGFDSFIKILKSIEILKNSKIPYEFRTTVVKGLHNEKEIKKIGRMVEGTEHFSLQNFKSCKTISKKLNKLNEFSEDEMENFKKILKKFVKKIELKNIC